MRTFVSLAVLFAALAAAGGAAATVAVSAPWSRPAIGTGVVYLTITNGTATPDRLLAAASPVAGAVELHDSTETRGTMGAMPGMAMGGIASMHPVAFITVPPHGMVALGPGGYHVMLIGLHHDLHAGEAFPIRLHFARRGWLTATVHVRPN